MSKNGILQELLVDGLIFHIVRNIIISKITVLTSSSMLESTRHSTYTYKNNRRKGGSVQPRVKICCISSLAEAKLAISYGAHALGLVGEMPSGPGVISDALIAEIAASVPPGVSTFLLTSRQQVDDIIAHQQAVGTSTIQLVDDLQVGSHRELREALPGIRIVQVLHVNGDEVIDKAKHLEGEVHAFLLDSGNQKLAIKELGGTGRTHDWSISRKVVEAVETPVFLAGGLRSSNIQAALREVHPYGVDLCSGVRTQGKLDEQKLNNFFSEVINSRQ